MAKILRISSFLFGAILSIVSGFCLLMLLGAFIGSIYMEGISRTLLEGSLYYSTFFYVLNFVMGLLYLRFSFNYFQENKFIKLLLFLFFGIIIGYLIAMFISFDLDSSRIPSVLIKSIAVIWLLELIIYKIFKKI